jgi:hypothetical protein
MRVRERERERERERKRETERERENVPDFHGSWTRGSYHSISYRGLKEKTSRMRWVRVKVRIGGKG